MSENPMEEQIGGAHYKNYSIQPMEYSEKNKLTAGEHSVVKYITRHKDKGGLEDLRKAIQCVKLVAWLQYGIDLDNDEG